MRREAGCRGGQRVVRLELLHRPDAEPQGPRHLLRRIELREQLRIDPLLGLVSGEEQVAKRADGVVERDRRVRDRLGGVVQEREEGSEQPGDRFGLRSVLRAPRRTPDEVGAEELPGPVDQVQPLDAARSFDHPRSFARIWSASAPAPPAAPAYSASFSSA